MNAYLKIAIESKDNLHSYISSYKQNAPSIFFKYRQIIKMGTMDYE